MERRNFIKNLGALLVASNIVIPETIAKISSGEIPENDIGNLEMILRYEWKEIRCHVLSGQVNINSDVVEFRWDINSPVEYFQGAKSWDIEIELKYISGLIHDFTSCPECEMILKLQGCDYYHGNGFMTSLSSDSNGIMNLEFQGSGPLTNGN